MIKVTSKIIKIVTKNLIALLWTLFRKKCNIITQTLSKKVTCSNDVISNAFLANPVYIRMYIQQIKSQTAKSFIKSQCTNSEFVV